MWVPLCLSRLDPLTRIMMAEHPFSLWVPLQCLSGSDPLTRNAEHSSSMWVPLQCLSTSHPSPLTRRAEHPFSLWVPMFEQIWVTSTDQKGWTPTGIQRVSPSPVFEALSRSDPLTRMAEHPSRMWVPPMFQQIRSTVTDETRNGWTQIQDVSHPPLASSVQI